MPESDDFPTLPVGIAIGTVVILVVLLILGLICGLLGLVTNGATAGLIGLTMLGL